jgi:phage shock protein PspC (stress-responsive transcriptional regulator)
VSHRKSGKRTLTLDKQRKKLLGVCAGVAYYLDVEPWSVRLVFLISIMFGGWFLIPIYFIAWFCLDDKPGEGLDSLANTQPLRHFRSVDYKKQLYRNTEDGKFLGICAGVADYLEVNVFAVRLVFLVLLILTSAIPLIVYFAAYFILEEKPLSKRQAARRPQAEARYAGFAGEMGSSHGGSRHRASAEHSADKAGERTSSAARPAQSDSRDLQHNDQDKAMDALVGKNYSKRREFNYCARKFATLQDRLAKMEAYVTSSQFRLHREFKNI